MSTMAPELLVAPLAVGGAAAQPGQQIEVGAVFSLTFSAIGAPPLTVQYLQPLGSMLIEVPDPVPVASAGGAIGLPLEPPLISARPRSKQWYLDWPEDAHRLGTELLSIDVPPAGSAGERWLTGSYFVPRDSIVVGHPMISDELIYGPSNVGGCQLAFKLDTVTGEAVSEPGQTMRLAQRDARWVLATASVELRLTFEPAIGLVYLRVPNPALRKPAAKAQAEQQEVEQPPHAEAEAESSAEPTEEESR